MLKHPLNPEIVRPNTQEEVLSSSLDLEAVRRVQDPVGVAMGILAGSFVGGR